MGPLAGLLDRCLSGNLGLGRLQLLSCWESRPLNFHSSLYLSQGGSLAFFGVTIPFSDSLPSAQSPGCLTRGGKEVDSPHIGQHLTSSLM